MKNFIWRIPLYLILVLGIIFLWWAISSLIKTYEEVINSLAVSQPCVCCCEKPKAENKISKPVSKPKPATVAAPKPKPVLAPKPVGPLPPNAPVPYVTPDLTLPPVSNPGPLPPNGPSVYNPPVYNQPPSGPTTYETSQLIGGLPLN